MTTSEQPVRLEAVTKRYGRKAAAATALDAVTLGFERASFTAVMGPSGSGKSTLLHCAAGLDRPTSGSVRLDGRDLAACPSGRWPGCGASRIGFVFQSFNLLPELRAADNVALPLRLAGRRPAAGGRPRPRRGRAGRAAPGAAGAAVRRPAAAGRHRPRPGPPARASSSPTSPPVRWTRPPRPRSSACCRPPCAAGGTTVVMVTHDPVAACAADRVVFLADGRIAGELRQPSAAAVADRMTRLAGRGPARGCRHGRAVVVAARLAGPNVRHQPARPSPPPFSRWPWRRSWSRCAAGCWRPACATTSRPQRLAAAPVLVTGRAGLRRRGPGRARPPARPDWRA